VTGPAVTGPAVTGPAVTVTGRLDASASVTVARNLKRTRTFREKYVSPQLANRAELRVQVLAGRRAIILNAATRRRDEIEHLNRCAANETLGLVAPSR
jgi:hypothetical protein